MSMQRPSLLGGLLWTGLGALFLLHNLGVGPDVCHTAGRYWPVLLILLGLGKLIDFYRRQQGISIRIGEVIGILFLLLVGSAITRVSRSPLTDFPLNVGGTSLRPSRWLGNSYTYTEETGYPVGAPTRISVENSYGLVSLAPGSDREVRVRLRKIVFENEESRAKEIANEIRLDGGPEGKVEAASVAVRTNRASLSGKGYRFNTDLEIFVPKNAEVQVRNAFGELKAANLEGRLDLSTSHEPLEVRDCTGSFLIANRYAESRLISLTGTVKVDARGAVYLSAIKGDVTVQDEFERVDLRDIDGAVSVTNTDSTIAIARVSKPVTVDARGSEVTATELADSLKIVTSHRRVQVSGVGPVSLQTSFATISLRGVKGGVNIESNSDRINLEDIQGQLQVRAKGSSVRANKVTGPVDIQTTLKDVIVNNLTSGCTILNEHGDITVSTATLSKDDWNVRTRNGAITIFLPQDAGFKIDASARNGRITSEFSELQPAESSDAAVLNARTRSDHPKILLENEYGNIGIRAREREGRTGS